MRYLILFFSLMVLNSCNLKDTQSKPEWLIGDWVRTNDKPNQKTFEFWSKDLKGLGFTLQGKDTISKEKISFIKQNDTLYLQVDMAKEKPTLFRVTQQTDTSFVCVNSENDFPNKIKYYLDGNLLKAEVSNDEFKIDFEFKKLKN